ncbi:MAG: hypothetical protein CMO80_24325 [Verrucomicrobiales bacterium]|nr:hypothetical protein [Verrucomicrobiales bacterium]
MFREFFELVEAKFSLEMLDDIIEESNLPSGGVYSSAGTYDHQEIVTVLVKLSERTGISVPDLLKTFGEHLIPVFQGKFPAFFDEHTEPLTFLESVDGYVHIEVRKLYPDAELPRFFCSRKDSHNLDMDYYSSRHLEDLAEGLISGALNYFGAAGEITRSEVEQDGMRGTRFSIRLH